MTRRLPGVTRPQDLTTARESIRSRQRGLPDQRGWGVGTLGDVYWPGLYTLSTRPMDTQINKVYMVPIEKLSREYTAEYVRVCNNAVDSANAATLTVGVYELQERTKLRLVTSTAIALTAQGIIEKRLEAVARFQPDVQYFIASLLTGTSSTTGPQLAVIKMDAQPLIGIIEMTTGGTLPHSVGIGRHLTASSVNEFPAILFLSEESRDLLPAGSVSGMAAYGCMYMSASSATTQVTTGTPVKAQGTTTAGPLKDFTMPANNRLTYVGTSTKTIFVTVSASTTKSDAGTDYVELILAKNGTAIVGPDIQRDLANNTDTGASSTSWLVSMDPNDYIELYLDREAANGADTVTVTHMTFTVHD